MKRALRLVVLPAILTLLLNHGFSMMQRNFNGITWTLMGWVDAKGVTQVVPTGQLYTLRFKTNNFIGQTNIMDTLIIKADCNTCSSTYSKSGDSLSIQVGCTKISCGTNSIESNFIDGLRLVKYHQVDGSRLNLLDKDKKRILFFDDLVQDQCGIDLRSNKDGESIYKKWWLQKIHTSKGEIVPTRISRGFDLTTGCGILYKDDCNNCDGRVTVSDTTFEIDASCTLVMCNITWPPPHLPTNYDPSTNWPVVPYGSPPYLLKDGDLYVIDRNKDTLIYVTDWVTPILPTQNPLKSTLNNFRVFSAKTNYLQISLGKENLGAKISVARINGDVIFSNQLNTNDLSLQLPSGLYLVHIKSALSEETKKVRVK